MVVFLCSRFSRLLAATLVGCAATIGLIDPGQAQPKTDRTGEIKLDRMRFTVVNGAGSQWIVAEGDIVPGSAEEFRALSRRQNLEGTRVLINSRGGSLHAALQLGIEFRRQGAAVAVAGVTRRGRSVTPVGGVCMSACVYALAGARTRVVPSGSAVGVHASFKPERRNGRLYIPKGRSADEAGLDEIKGRYFAAMGIDPSIVQLESGVSPTQIRRLSGSELRQYGLAGSTARRVGGNADYDRSAR